MTLGYFLVICILFFVANFLLAWLLVSHTNAMQARWDTERQILLDRIQAGSFNEYQHFKSQTKPRIRNPLRKGLFPDEIPDDDDEGGDR